MSAERERKRGLVWRPPPREDGRKPGRVPRHSDWTRLPDDALYDEARGPRIARTRPPTPARIVSGKPEPERNPWVEHIIDRQEPGCVYYRADHMLHCENVPYPDQWSVVVRARNGTVSSVLHGRNGMTASQERINQSRTGRWPRHERKPA